MLTSSLGDLTFLVNTSYAATSDFKIATYHLLKTDPGGASWSKGDRGSKLMSYLRSVDIAGLQEVNEPARSDLNGEMKNAGYSKTKFDDTVDIIWKNSVFTLVDQGDTLALNDAKCGTASGVVKHAVWVKLKENSSGQEFYFLTTHLDVNAQSCRLKQIKKIADSVLPQLTDSIPTIFVGDMNSKTGSDEDTAIKALGFGDSYTLAGTKTNINSSSTLHGGLGGTRRGGQPIDHIYVKGTVSIASIEIKDQFGSDHLPVEAIASLSGGGSTATIGAYNVLGCNHTSGNVTDRMSTLAKNINDLAYDVVGMSEYNVKECQGKLIEQLDTYGNWKDTKHYSADNIEQTGIIYNADKVTLESEEVLDTISGCKTMNDYARTDGPGQRGGSCYVRIARFMSSSGTEFVVANGHYAMDHSVGGGQMRANQVKSVIDKLSSETVPVFIVGDTNAAPPYATSDRGKEYYTKFDYLFYNELEGSGYQIASQTASQKVNADFATVGGSEGSEYQIDQVFYRNIAAPSYFEVLNCEIRDDGSGSCGSDHRPIKAIFGSNGCGDDSTDPNTNMYKALNYIHYTGSNSVCCATLASSDGSGALTGSTNAEKAFNFLTSVSLTSNGGKPLNAAQAAGIVGNLMAETGGDTYSLKPNAVNGIGAAGIVQWYKGRRTALNKFAQQKGKDWTDLKTQLQFLVYELDSDYYAKVVMKGSGGGKDINKGLANVTDISESGVRVAADIIGRWYETPSISDHYPGRQDDAIKAFNDFSGSGTGSTGDGSASTLSATTATASASSCSQEIPGDLTSTVKEFVWADGRRGAAQKAAYTEAVKQSKYGNDGAHNYGNDCGAFIYILMTTSGFEPDYPGVYTGGQMDWLASHWDKLYDVGKVDTSQLQQGDIAIREGHVFVWIGDIDGFDGKSAEAALKSDTAPTTVLSSNTYSDPNGYTWYRKKGTTDATGAI